VDSIINQSYKNLEIILIDDGSPDKCGEICDQYPIIDSRVKVNHKIMVDYLTKETLASI
jgi:glycosyltransferase involved in cell wall biosynthesis